MNAQEIFDTVAVHLLNPRLKMGGPVDPAFSFLLFSGVRR